jgi:hypothetical protein
MTVTEEGNPWLQLVAPMFLFPSSVYTASTEALRYAMLALGAVHLEL